MDRLTQFKKFCGAYLQEQTTQILRTYGRKIGLQYPTKLKKAPLIEEIIAVLCGEKSAHRVSQGAPARNDYLPDEFLAHMDELLDGYFTGVFPVSKVHILQVERMENGSEGMDTSKPCAPNDKTENGGLKVSLDISNLTDEQIVKLTNFIKKL